MDTNKQKLVAFLCLVASVLGLAAISLFVRALEKDGTTVDPAVLQAKLTILNMAMGGVIAALGVGAQSFFKHSQTEQDMAATAKIQAEALPVPPKQVEVINPPEAPVQVEAAITEELPEYAR